MSNKELKELMSIICEGQDSEQRRKVENFIEYQVQLIDSLDKEIEILHSIMKEVRECLNKNRIYITGERNLAFEIEEILDKVGSEDNGI